MRTTIPKYTIKSETFAELKEIYGIVTAQFTCWIPARLREKALDVLQRRGMTLQDYIRSMLHVLVESNSTIEPEPHEEQPKPEPEPKPKAEENIRQSVIEAAYEIVLEDLKSRRNSTKN